MSVESESLGVLPVRFRPNVFADAVSVPDGAGKHISEFLCYAKSSFFADAVSIPGGAGKHIAQFLSYAKSADFNLLFCRCCGSGEPEIFEIKGPEETEYRIDVEPRQLAVCPTQPLFASLIVRGAVSEVAVWNTDPGLYHLAAKLDEGPDHGMHYRIPGIRQAKSVSWLHMEGQANADASRAPTLVLLLPDAVAFAAVQRRSQGASWQVRELFRVAVSGSPICFAWSKSGSRLLVGGHGQITCIAWDRAPSPNGVYEVRHFVCAGDCTEICAVYESAFVCRVEQNYESGFASSECSLALSSGQQPNGIQTQLIEEAESNPQDRPSEAQGNTIESGVNVQSSMSNQNPRRRFLVPFDCRWHARCGEPLEVSAELLAVGLHQQTEHIVTASFDGPARVSFWRLAPPDRWKSSSDIWQQAIDADLTSECNGMQICGLAVWHNGIDDACCHVMLAEASGDRPAIGKNMRLRCLPMPSLSANCNVAIASVAAVEIYQFLSELDSVVKDEENVIAGLRSIRLESMATDLLARVECVTTEGQKENLDLQQRLELQQQRLNDEQARAMELQNKLTDEHLETVDLQKQLQDAQTKLNDEHKQATQLQMESLDLQKRLESQQQRLNDEHAQAMELEKKQTLDLQKQLQDAETKLNDEHVQAMQLQKENLDLQKRLESQQQRLNDEYAQAMELQKKLTDEQIVTVDLQKQLLTTQTKFNDEHAQAMQLRKENLDLQKRLESQQQRLKDEHAQAMGLQRKLTVDLQKQLQDAKTKLNDEHAKAMQIQKENLDLQKRLQSQQKRLNDEQAQAMKLRKELADELFVLI